MKKKFQSKATMRRAVESLEGADKALESIRDHFGMEWGDNGHCDLDVSLSSALRKIAEAKREIEETLAKYKGKAVTPHFPRKRKAPPAVTVRDLQKALVC